MWYQLRPGTSTYLAPGMCSAMYLPFAGGMTTPSACWTTSRHTDCRKDRPQRLGTRNGETMKP
jgi:hypothetical protein